MTKWIAPVAVLTLALGGAGLFVANATAQEANSSAAVAKVGARAPLFSLKDQDGKTVDLGTLSDKVVVLEWFNDGCPFVVKHYSQGDMNTLASKYTAKGVVWLAVNTTASTDAAHNKKVAGDWKINRPILDDSEGTVGKLYGAKTTPHMFVINKGTIVYNGAIDSIRSSEASDVAKAENYVAKALDEVLAGQSVSTAETKPYGCSVKFK